MLKLLKKELKLTASPLSYLFIAFTAMTLIPQYPILVCGFFVCFGIFQTFQKAREANDTLYSALLPVNKTDVVSAKFLFAVFIQAAAFTCCAVLVLLRVLLLNKFVPYNTNPLMNANLAYLGYLLIIFAWFNIFFLGGFFKTAYKIGVPFLIFCALAFVTVGVGEALHYFPYLYVLNYNFHYSHLIIFFAGLIVYVGGTVLTLKLSQKKFNEIDL